ncbi:MAG: DUF1415 domain-containing protein [Bacteroidetes bacterium]|nr:MAG: DUF1415 domain-containing protein [Bacteroidota bacterium]
MNQFINPTRNWVRSVIIGLNFCPFAKREFDRETIRYAVLKGKVEDCLESLILECDLLNGDETVETTLVILPEGFESFDDFLDFLDLSNDLLHQQGYEGVFQLASFHPDYCFQGVPKDDPANFTNRSPFPMLHIIREASLEKAIAFHPDPEGIPERNIELARQMGEEKLKKLLAACF